METARFVLTPYFEIIDVIVPLARLRIDKCSSENHKGRVEGQQITEFCVRYDHSILLSESRRQRNNSFNIRSLIRFCKFDEMRCDKYGIKLKDVLPLHLQITLNNSLILLPNLLPNDRSGKDGRRFPRPVDLTEVLIDNPIIQNRIIINWMQDEVKNEEYYFAIYLARLRPCDELCGILLNQQMSNVSSTLNIVYDQCNNLNGAVDEDLMLVNTSINTSLNCPVSRDRMKIPIRGQNCNHLQCFDCMTYLIINFKKPTWQCPVCDKKTFYCYLEVDGLIFNILKDERSASVECIQFNNNGQWRPQTKSLSGVEDDQPYYDVINYIKPSQSPESTISSSSIILNESLSEHKVQEHLRQIFNNQTIYMNTHPGICQPNLSSSVSTSNIKCKGDPMNVPNNGLSDNSVLCNNSISLHNTYGYTMSATSSQPPTIPYNSTSNDQYLPSNTALQHTNHFVQSPLNSQNHNSNLPQSQVNDVLRTPSMVINEITSRLQITNVISMAQNIKSLKDIIVISDDDVDDTNSIKDVIVNNEKKCQKRPIAVSSVPNDVCSSKQMKILKYSNLIFQRPNSVSLNDFNSRLKQLQHLCKCTSERVCPFHAKSMEYVKKTLINPHKLNHTSNPNKISLTSSMSSNSQNKSSSNCSLLNDNNINVPFQSSISMNALPAKQHISDVNIPVESLFSNTSNTYSLKQPPFLNEINSYIPTYSIPQESNMTNGKIRHVVQKGIYTNTFPYASNGTQMKMFSPSSLPHGVNAQNQFIPRHSQYTLGNNSSINDSNLLNDHGQPLSPKITNMQPFLIRDPSLLTYTQSVNNNIPINKINQNNAVKHLHAEMCQDKVTMHDFRRDVKLPSSITNCYSVNMLEQSAMSKLPFNGTYSQPPVYPLSHGHHTANSMMIPHGLNANNNQFIFPYVDIPRKLPLSYDNQHLLNHRDIYQGSMPISNLNFQSNNIQNFPNNVSHEIIQQSEVIGQSPIYRAPTSLQGLCQPSIIITPTLYQEVPFQNMNTISQPRYQNPISQIPQMIIPNSKPVSTDLPSTYNCNPNYLNMLYNA